jgi:hypothetical protein
MTGPERLGNLFKIDGIWQKFSCYERPHLCDICSHRSYTWKEFDIHKKLHTEKEHLRALWSGVDSAIERMLLWGVCPT